MSEALEAKVEELTARLVRVEDELNVHRLIVRYGFAVDCGDADATMALFTEDTVFEVGAVGTGLDPSRDPVFTMNGREAVGAMVRSDTHQNLLPNSAHTPGPIVVEVDGDTAHATGYTRIYHREEDGGYRLFRIAVNDWDLVKRAGRWQIARRRSEIVGTTAAQGLMRLGLE